MTYDQLVRAQELWKNIVEIKKRIEVLQNGYANSILGWDYRYKSDGERISFSLDGGLREIVVKYLQEELKPLENEFKNLQLISIVFLYQSERRNSDMSKICPKYKAALIQGYLAFGDDIRLNKLLEHDLDLIKCDRDKCQLWQSRTDMNFEDTCTYGGCGMGGDWVLYE